MTIKHAVDKSLQTKMYQVEDVQRHGESEDEMLQGVKLYEWKMCIYKQNSQNFVTNMRKMRLLELLLYIFIVNLSTYKSDIETVSHLTLT